METTAPHPHDRSRSVNTGRIVIRCAVRSIIAMLLLWCFGAIRFDGPLPSTWNLAIAVLWLAATVVLLLRARTVRDRWLSVAGCISVVIVPWSFKRPSNDRNWAPEYARVASSSINGDEVTLSNFRNFARTSSTVESRWESRSVRLSNLRGIDLFLTYWGSPLIAHPVFSFDFGEDGRIAFSIETRREEGETYTTFGGLYKLYELTYLAGDERDFIFDRTNIRKGEETYLYRLSIGPEKARIRFLEFIDNIRALEQRPRFYNVLTANCTTAIRSQIETADRGPFDWRLVANGKLDELLHERNLLVDEGLPFTELKRHCHINGRALKCGDDPRFSELLRVGVPGFGPGAGQNP